MVQPALLSRVRLGRPRTGARLGPLQSPAQATDSLPYLILSHEAVGETDELASAAIYEKGIAGDVGHALLICCLPQSANGGRLHPPIHLQPQEEAT